MTLYDILEIGFKTSVIGFMFLSLRGSKNTTKVQQSQSEVLLTLLEDLRKRAFKKAIPKTPLILVPPFLVDVDGPHDALRFEEKAVKQWVSPPPPQD